MYLLHRDVSDDHWSLPGGRVRVGEETASSVVREFFEELGAKVKIDRLLWINEHFFEYRKMDFHEIGFYYKVSVDNSMSYFQTDSFYGIEGKRLVYRWMPVKEINKMIIVPEFLKENLKALPQTPQHLISQ